MERGSTFFGVFGQIIQNCVRWIIRVGRRYQILAATYLVVFFVVLINMGNQPAVPPNPTSSQPPISSPVPNPVPYSNPNPEAAAAPNANPAPIPTIEVAQVQVYKNGNFVTIRFDKPVSEVRLSIDGASSFTPSCQNQICTTTISPEALSVQVTWFQGVESFSTKFRL